MEATKIKMNMDGTIRAKVLQYKSDGNTLTEKRHTLTKFAEGIYLSYAAPDQYGQVYATVVFAKNGVFWKAGCDPEQCFRPDSFRYAERVECLKRRYANYEADIMQAVENGGWLNKLHITVMERLGHDTTAIIEAYNEVRRQREERERQQAEEAERRERERKEAEERRKAEVLADGKEKLLKHESITVEQIELIAEAVGYKINIRTIGFMREKVTEAVMLDNDRVQVFGYKLTSRNIDGTAKVMHELYDRLKAQAEEEANKSVRHISEIMETCRTWDVETRDYTDEYKYYTWLANHIPEHKATNKNTTGLILEEVRERISAAATLAAHGVPKCDIEGAVCAIVNHLTTIECVMLSYAPTQPATPAETPRIVRVEIVRDFDKSYYANLYDENGGSHNLSHEYTDFRTLKTLCKKEYGVNLPNLSQIEFETHGRKSYAYISTETPRISTETAEAANVSAEGKKAAETRENTPKRKIQYFHYTLEQLKRYIIDVYEKRANGEWVLLPYEQIDTDAGLWDVVDGKIGWWTNWRREKFSEMNMDFNSPTCGRCCKINRTYQKDNFIVSNEKLLEFTINGNYYYIQKQTYSKGKHRWCYTIMDAHGDFAVNDFSYTKRGIMQRFNKWWKKNATIIWQASEAPTEPPQSPETPQTVECTADMPKQRETARKRQNRGIGRARATQHSGLGANGYAMLDNASATLTAMHVPRECSTAEAAYW